MIGRVWLSPMRILTSTPNTAKKITTLILKQMYNNSTNMCIGHSKLRSSNSENNKSSQPDQIKLVQHGLKAIRVVINPGTIINSRITFSCKMVTNFRAVISLSGGLINRRVSSRWLSNRNPSRFGRRRFWKKKGRIS